MAAFVKATKTQSEVGFALKDMPSIVSMLRHASMRLFILPMDWMLCQGGQVDRSYLRMHGCISASWLCVHILARCLTCSSTACRLRTSLGASLDS